MPNSKAYTSTSWRDANKDRHRANSYNYRLQQRALVLKEYGGACACCGETDFHFLTIDHIDGYVPESHRKANGTRKYGPDLINQIIRDGFPDTIRVLCWNCNSSIGVFGFCPHNPPSDSQLRFDMSGDPIQAILPETAEFIPISRKGYGVGRHKEKCINGHTLEDAYVTNKGHLRCRICAQSNNRRSREKKKS